MAIDPVCGIAVDESVASAIDEHDGVTYYFCSLACERRFAENPSAYTGNGHAAAVPQTTAPAGRLDNVERRKVHFHVSGMYSTECAVRIKRALADTPGVLAYNVNLTLEEAVVEYDAAQTDEAAVRTAITGAGYTVAQATDSAGGGERGDLGQTSARRVVAGVALSVAAIMLTVAAELPGRDLLLLVLACTAYVYVGAPFHIRAWRRALARRFSADLLIVLGAGLLLAYSVYGLFRGVGAMYFHTSVVVLTVAALGRWVEDAATRRSLDAVGRLTCLRPQYANVLRDDREIRVPVSEVQVGDMIIVRPGEVVPTDGVVAEGQSSVDEAGPTGNRLPLLKVSGDRVLGGSVNREGKFKFRATRVGVDTALEEIVRLVQHAEASAADVCPGLRKAADKLPLVALVLAIAAGVGWYTISGRAAGPAVFAAAAMLLAVSPVSMRLAVSAVLTAGLGLGSENGILVKTVATFRRMQRATCTVFDKAGCITREVPDVATIVPSAGCKAEHVLAAAAAAVQSDNKPVARAITHAAEGRALEVPAPSEVEEIPNEGTVARLNGRRVLVGNAALMERHNVSFARLNDEIDRLERERTTIVYVAEENQPLGMLAVAEAVRPSSRPTIDALKRMGLRTIMLSADTGVAADTVAETVGVDEVVTLTSSQAKAEVVQQLHDRGERVMLVGDGVSDADAIALAEVGVALGAGTEVTSQTGDVVLIGDELYGVVHATVIGRRAARKAQQNMVFAVGYNCAAALLAALGMLPPVAAATAAAASAAAVAVNALLMRRTKLETFVQQGPNP